MKKGLLILSSLFLLLYGSIYSYCQCLNVAIGKPAIASSASNGKEAQKAFDGDCATQWNAGIHPLQWILVDLLDTFLVQNIKLETEMLPDCYAKHNIYISSDMVKWTLLDTIYGNLKTSQKIVLDYGSSPIPQVRGVKIETIESLSWVAWHEIGVYVKGTSKAKITYSGSLHIQQGDTVILTASGGKRYKWSTGDSAKSIVAKNEGWYYVSVVDPDCLNIDNTCTSTDSVFVSIGTHLTVSIPDLIADVGAENFPIPIKFTNKYKTIYNPSFKAKVRFNATSYYTTGISPGNIIDIKPDTGPRSIVTIEYTGNAINSSDTVITNILGTVLLGDSVSKIHIDELEFGDNTIKIDSILDGRLILQGCGLKFRRQVFNPPNFTITANPIQSNISVKTGGDGDEDYVFGIYSVQGTLIVEIKWRNSKDMNRQLNFDTKNYSDGIYFACLRTRWNVIVQKLMIIK